MFSFAFCDAQLACTTFVVNDTLRTQAISGNAQYFFIGTDRNVLIYAALPQPTLLATWNPLSIGNDGVAFTSAASESGSLAVVGFSSGLLLFLTNDGSGQFKETPLRGRPWTATAVACSDTAVVAAFASAYSYNISFYQASSAGAVPQLVASYSPFPGSLREEFITAPLTAAITSDGRHAIVGGFDCLGCNFWIFDLSTIDAKQGTIDPPFSGFLPGSVLHLSLADRLGRLGVATLTSNPPTSSTNLAFGFNI